MLLKSAQKQLDELFRIGAIQIDTKKGFRLAKHEENPSLPLSPYFYNFRTKDNPKPGPLQQEHVDSIAQEILTAVQKAKIEFDAVTGVPRAGTPFAKAIIGLLKKQNKKVGYIALRKRGDSRTLSVRHEHKYRGAPDKAPRVLIIDDLITSKTMKARALNVLRDANFQIAGIGVYMDREEGGSKDLASEGVRFAAAVTTTKALQHYVDSGQITHRDAEIINRYRRTA